jgi:hypothetical protein
VLIRPYRFGIFFGIINALGGLYYGWLAIHSSSVPGAIVLALSALLSIVMGCGILLRRRFGVHLMHFSFLLFAVEAITDWFKPDEHLLSYIFWNLVFFAAMLAVIRYFSKRYLEFVYGLR